MKKLARNWRRYGDNAESNLSLPVQFHDDDNSRPFDTQQQEELVRSLEKDQAHQSLLWRRVFASLLLCHASFLVYSVYQQTVSPWELRFNAYFMEDIDSWVVISADWLAVLACSMIIVGLLHNLEHQRRWIWHGFSVGTILAVFWLYYMLRMPRFHWDALWLPLGPLSSGASVCLYVIRLLNESSEEVRKLRSYMYAYKAS